MKQPAVHLALLLLLCTLSTFPVLAEKNPDAFFYEQFDDLATHTEEILLRMSPEERLAQMLMIGWPSVEPSPLLMQWINERNIGAVKIFGWNGNNVPELADSISLMQQAAARQGTGIPIITSTDQEGGWVRHIKDLTSITPGNLAIGASGLSHDAFQSGKIIAEELRLMGVNMNLAPTVDVYTHPEAHVIGPRAFSDDPLQTAILGTAFYQGHEIHGVMATGKHFPGHGAAAGDSHLLLPTVEVDMDTLWERDLLPFRMLIAENIPALLSGHLSFPLISGDNTPASFSNFFHREVLREQLGFEGLIVTDDLYMYGALDYGYQYGEEIPGLVIRAIRTGSDMIMLSTTPELNGELWQLLVSNYNSDPDFAETVDNSARRIIRTKLRYLHDPEYRVPLFPDSSSLPSIMPSEKAREFFMDQAARSVTLFGSEELPEFTGNERILLTGHNTAFFRVGREFFPGADEYRFQNRNFYFSNSRDRLHVREIAERYDYIIYALSDPNSGQVLQELEAYADRVIVFSLLTPVYLSTVPWVQRGVAVYGWTDDPARAGFSVLKGKIEARGSMPVQSLIKGNR